MLTFLSSTWSLRARLKRRFKRARNGAGSNFVHLVPLIVDHVIGGGLESGPSASLLTLPMGTGTLLSHLSEQLADLGDADPIIVSPLAGDTAYRDRIGKLTCGDLKVLGPDEVGAFVGDCEDSDHVLLVDSRYCPLSENCLAAVVQAGRGYRGLTNAVAAGGDRDSVREFAELDHEGRVRHIRRLYEKASCLDIGSNRIMCSVLPARQLQDVTFASLGDLRATLAGKGLLIQDLAIPTPGDDLARETGFMSLSERMIETAVQHRWHQDYTSHAPGVLAGRDCTIHPSARLIGPVIVQHGARVDENSTLIGPTVIGQEAHVERNTVVSRSVVGLGARVPENSVAYGHIIVEGGVVATQQTTPALSLQRVRSSDAGPIEPIGFSRRLQLAAKRAFDVAAATIGLIVLSPLLMAVAVVIKLTSPGPVFFVHWREGRNGRDFPCIKFRTMVQKAHRLQRDYYERNDVDGPQFKLKRDPRVTRLGSWLRATNIDEIPQLINVLVGHMSLVGPRPSPFRENQICIPWRKARLSVRPGITGLWQICRDRGDDGDFHEWVYYDLAYVRSFSLMVDLRILVHTILSRGGARKLPMAKILPDPRHDRSQGHDKD